MRAKITIDDKIYEASDGDNLAALLLREGLVPFRKNPADKSARAAYCMMGVCYECLVEVDGIRSTQACLVAVNDGMIIKRNLDD